MLFTPNYLPCIAFFKELRKAENIIFDKSDIFIKQTFRNRAQIKGPHRLENLIIPVSATSGKTPISDVKVANNEPWQRTHIRTIEAAYKKSPYYEFYDYMLLPLFEKKYDFLLDVQIDSFEIILKMLNLKLDFAFETRSEGQIIIDLRPKEYEEIVKKYDFRAYKQNFEGEFIPNLSILDLIFCNGPHAVDFL